MDPSIERAITQQIIDGIKVENPLNREGDALPFGLYNPETEGKVSWICDRDATGRIISVFMFKDGAEKDRQVQVIEMEQAITTRDILLGNGWRPIQLPKITFRHPETDEERNLTRKEKRKLQRHLRKEIKRNPLLNETDEGGAADDGDADV